jgi:type VI secretion system protein
MDFMKLIFKIINNPSCGTPSEKCKVFRPELTVIGRSLSSDWVLPDPERFISSKHAEVDFRDNQFYLTDVSSNGTINGDTDEVIGNGQELLITDGQTFLIGEYLIQAELEGIAESGQHKPAQSIASEHADWDNQMDDFWGNSSDPLDLLAPDRATTPVSIPSESAPSLANSLERTPAFKQAMNFSHNIEAEAERSVEPESVVSSGIPENWDNTSFSFPEPEAKSTPPISAQTVQHSIQQPVTALDDISSDDDFFLGLAGESFFNEELPQAASPSPSPSPIKLERPASSRPRKRQQKENTANINATPKSNNNLLEAAQLEFEQQGLNKELLTENVAAQWLSLMPTVMQSTIELLQARAAIKNEFRVSKTLLTTSENNPLKFSTNAEDAINSLFHQNRPGFLTSDLAFEQAFRDINRHQSALLHGVRVAMMDLLKQFDADSLEDSFMNSNKKSGLLDKFSSTKSSQAKLWQQYKELYKSEYKVDSDDSFQRIFGETFAQAYDEFSTTEKSD